MTNDPIFPQTAVGQMSDFVKQENARRKTGGHSPTNPFPENETTPAGQSLEDRLEDATSNPGVTSVGGTSGPPSIDSIWLKRGQVYLSDGQKFDLPLELLEQIILIAIKGFQIATEAKIKAMALHHGLKVVEQPAPEMETYVDEPIRTNSKPKGRPRK